MKKVPKQDEQVNLLHMRLQVKIYGMPLWTKIQFSVCIYIWNAIVDKNSIFSMHIYIYIFI